MCAKTFYHLARALHWHAIWQAFVCPSSNPVHMLVRWRARSSGPHGWMGGRARARAQRACRSVWRVGGEEEEKRGGREERRKRREEEEERRRKRRRRRRRRKRGEVSPEKPAAGEL